VPQQRSSPSTPGPSNTAAPSPAQPNPNIPASGQWTKLERAPATSNAKSPEPAPIATVPVPVPAIRPSTSQHPNAQPTWGSIPPTTAPKPASSASASSAPASATATAPNKPLGYITQPNGQKDPYYATPPCLTTRQTGPTSYECTGSGLGATT